MSREDREKLKVARIMINKLLAEVNRLKSGLEFYSDNKSWKAPNGLGIDQSEAVLDRGDKATEIITGEKKRKRNF